MADEKSEKSEKAEKAEKKPVVTGTPVPLKPQTGALSANTQCAAAYHDHLQEGIGLVHEALRGHLDFYWKFGKNLTELDSNKAKYGSKTLETYLVDLKKGTNGSVSLEKSLAYAAMAFFRKVDVNQLNQLKAKFVSWTQAKALTDGKLTDDARDQIIAGVNTNKIEPTKVADMVDKLTKASKGKAAKASAPKPLTVLKGAIELFSHMGDKLNGVGEAAESIFKGDSAENMKTAKGLIKELEDAIEVVVGRGEKELKIARDAAAKAK